MAHCQETGSSYYELDLAGNVRRLRDKTGADLGGYRYTAFGQMLAADGGTPAPSVEQPLRWKGRMFVDVAGGIYDGERGVGLLPEFALGTAFSGLSTSGGLTAVTSWAPQGVDATIAAGRWVMLGGATIRNWLLTGMGTRLPTRRRSMS
ncbi:MAG: hypothetical protein M3O50_16715 [Myxococcota bacterium]|nr:hypothetical protein [Myxococcota bacterium]